MTVAQHNAPSTSGQPDSRRLARIIFPRKGESRDVRALYVVENESATAGRVTATSRTSCVIPAGDEVSFQTYFNALPASYWRRWSQLREVMLRVELTGEAHVQIFRSTLDGARVAVTGKSTFEDGATEANAATAGGSRTLELLVSLAPFEDGGWIWFDITCETETEIHSAGWYATVDAQRQVAKDTVVYTDPDTGKTTTYTAGDELPLAEPALTVGIPTFNRPTDAVAALRALASDDEVMAVIDRVIMPDQGSKHPTDEPDFDEVAAAFGDRLQIHRQGNLGGSGGYSRIMYEARHPKRGTRAGYILYMDDDIAIEPDSVLRALAAARYAASPMLIGGQMLNLQKRSHLHTMGEVIDRSNFMWSGAAHSHYDHDFATRPLSDTGQYVEEFTGKVNDMRNMHRRIDVDFNGWWMCLIPRVVADTVGQPLPLFIKWDDTEYGLRTQKVGFPTASWPGIAIWHMAWSDKDDAIDWQAYFHLRNRLVVAALNHEGSVDGIIASLAKALAKHLLCLEYSTIAIHNEAIKDFLAGPEQLFDILETSLPRINALRKNFSDATVLPSATSLPPATGGLVALRGAPPSMKGKLSFLVKGVINNLKPADAQHHHTPQLNLPPVEAHWYNLSRVDGATVTTADGSGVVFRKRDRAQALALMKDSIRLQRELRAKFAEMQSRYRQAHEHLVSTGAWAEIFEPAAAADAADTAAK